LALSTTTGYLDQRAVLLALLSGADKHWIGLLGDAKGERRLRSRPSLRHPPYQAHRLRMQLLDRRTRGARGAHELHSAGGGGGVIGMQHPSGNLSAAANERAGREQSWC